MRAVRAALFTWYDVARRDLPWRHTRDPYHIWVSEVMLQQTRVETVTPYYQRWLARFPTVHALADAPQDDVLKAWEGLGYYSRARNLHAAARVVRERLNGAVPSSYDELRRLPGVGEYTAGAIASIAYGAAVPAVDGNVRRVLARLYDVAAPTATHVRDLAHALVDTERAGDFNQALMELGATVCIAAKPRCSACPLRSHCRAFAHGTVARRPGAKPKRPVPHESVNVLVHLLDDRVLLVKRPQRGLLGGMWSFPECDDVPGTAEFLGKVMHAFTHKRVTYSAWLVRETMPKAGDWVAITDVSQYALPVAQRKILALLAD